MKARRKSLNPRMKRRLLQEIPNQKTSRWWGHVFHCFKGLLWGDGSQCPPGTLTALSHCATAYPAPNAIKRHYSKAVCFQDADMNGRLFMMMDSLRTRESGQHFVLLVQLFVGVAYR